MFSVSKRPTIAEIHELYEQEKAMPSQVAQFFLNRAKQNDKKIQAVDNYTEDLALSQGALLDEILSQADTSQDGWFKKILEEYSLFGIPFAVKSIINVKGEVGNASSKLLNGYRPPYSATVYQKMEKAGAILVAIVKMDEFAMGSSGESSSYGVTRNPFDLTRVPGGSSSGPAAVVASGQVVFALGTDTGGSIRQPAAFCSVVGIKPTYGLVSRYGVMPMASSFDQVGPITNSVTDNIILTQILAGKDVLDQTSLNSQDLQPKLSQLLQPSPKTRPSKKLLKTKKSLKIGIPSEFYGAGIDPQITAALDKLKVRLQEVGHELVEVSLPLTKYAIAVYYMTMTVEVAANLERFDGIRYRGENSALQNEEMFFSYREKYFGAEPKRRILLGTYASSSGYYDAYYNRASQVKELARRDMDRVFKSVDVLLTPTTPEFPFKIGQKTTDPLAMYLSDALTCGINPVRIPGLVVPLGLFDVEDKSGQPRLIVEDRLETVEHEDGETVHVVQEEIGVEVYPTVKLPTGCQILGPELSEDVLFSLGLEIEQIVGEASSLN
jgi:aspartyl-tRNA(Asn)/glutamyl-tRNA(Gln) amidotransferase subunit A